MAISLVISLLAPAASAASADNKEASKDNSLHVQIVLYDGFDLMDALGPYEVFAAAGMFAEGMVSVELVSAEGKRSVPSGLKGPALEAQAALNPNRPGIIVVPGASGKRREIRKMASR